MEVPLYDLSPVAQLLLVALLLAAGPLLWVVLRNRGTSAGQRLRALTLITLFLTFDLVMFGAFTRLTDSGLGCPDWPGCYGQATPLAAHAPIAAAQQAMPTGPVTHGKAWVEMLHRYLAGAVGALIVVLTVAAWRTAAKERSVSPWWPTAALVWVCVQGAFGALTVTMKLFPAIVSIHLLGGYGLLLLLTAQAARMQPADATMAPRARPWMRGALVAAMGLLLLQAASGAWVSTNYAVLACDTFPQCQGSWWPPMDAAQGFTLWRPLGLDVDGTPVSFAALTAIHWAHRLLAFVTIAALGVIAFFLGRSRGFASYGGWLAALLALQFTTGVSNVVLDWPLAAAVLHTGGAGAMLVVLTWALASTHSTAGTIRA